MKAPHGLIDIWRITRKDSNDKWLVVGAFRTEEAAYQAADSLWERLGIYIRKSITVEHKAAIEIKKKFYVVNVLPFKFTEPEPVDDRPHQSDGDIPF
jgi:hypothetical protein